MAVLRGLVDRKQTTVLCVTHDPRVVPLADRVWWLEDGQLSDLGTRSFASGGRPRPTGLRRSGRPRRLGSLGPLP